MTKTEFYERLCLAGKTARDFAASYIADDLPTDLCFTIQTFGIRHGTQGPPGTIKIIGGRFVQPDDLLRVNARRAASLLWVDGKVPAWVNLGVIDYANRLTELYIRFCSRIVMADVNLLPPDARCEPGNPIVPFRIRGPGTPNGWRSVELDGRINLKRDSENAG